MASIVFGREYKEPQETTINALRKTNPDLDNAIETLQLLLLTHDNFIALQPESEDLNTRKQNNIEIEQKLWNARLGKRLNASALRGSLDAYAQWLTNPANASNIPTFAEGKSFQDKFADALTNAELNNLWDLPAADQSLGR